MTIEQAAVKTLSRLNLKDELSIDIVNLAIVSIIGFSAVRCIMKSDDTFDYKYICISDLLAEADDMNINEMIGDFLNEEDDNE